MAKPAFVISLDFELGWGFVLHPEHTTLNLLRDDLQHGRGVVESLLNLFQKFHIPATWAAVGHLLLEQGDGKGLISKGLPQFKEGWLNWDFYSQVCSSPLYMAPDIIEKILRSPVGHEIGLHSFFHIPFSRCSKAVAEMEVKLGVNLAQKWGIETRSFVFPENSIGHLDILREQGIKIYRGNVPRHRKQASSALIRKVTGAVMIMMPPSVLPLWKEGIWEIPGSMSFDEQLIPFTTLPKAKIGLVRAIRADRLFHIWIHPWSLLYGRSLFEDLENFLALVAHKRDKGNLQVVTMGEVAVEAESRR